MHDRDLAGRVRVLLADWDTRHADWCCRKGCTWPDGQHIELNPSTLIPTTTVPCTGACTCDIDNYVVPLRAALEEATGADPR